MWCTGEFVRCVVLLCVYVSDDDVIVLCFFFFQAEDGIRDLVRSRGLGDVYKRQENTAVFSDPLPSAFFSVATTRSAPLKAGASALTLSLIHI